MPSAKKNKRILVICPYPEGVAAGQRLKYEQYIDQWRENGYDVTISPFMDMKMWSKLYEKGNFFTKAIGTLKGQLRRIRDLFRIRNYDGVYLFMWVTPLGTAFFERMVLWLAKGLVYDVEDNIFVEKSNDLNKFAKLLKGAGKTKVLVAGADHVITSSPFLNDYCLGINEKKQCTFVSSSVNGQRYVKADRDTNEVLVIGWTGTFTSVRFLDMLRPALKKLAENRKFKLLVIGNFDYDFPEMNLEVIRWTKEKEIEDLQKIDIGVYPLPEEDWVLGKSGLKVIQYMAMSLPTVSTNYGTAMEIIDHGQNGFLANTESEWIERMTELIDDAALRSRLGVNARKTVDSKYSTDVIGHQYLSVLNQVFEK
jgi:glycosyltransferase involved in cell wall biosynthesis